MFPPCVPGPLGSRLHVGRCVRRMEKFDSKNISNAWGIHHTSPHMACERTWVGFRWESFWFACKLIVHLVETYFRPFRTRIFQKIAYLHWVSHVNPCQNKLCLDLQDQNARDVTRVADSNRKQTKNKLVLSCMCACWHLYIKVLQSVPRPNQILVRKWASTRFLLEYIELPPPHGQGVRDTLPLRRIGLGSETSQKIFFTLHPLLWRRWVRDSEYLLWGVPTSISLLTFKNEM